MNIEEAKRKLHNMAFRDLQTKPYDLKLADVMQILNQIELNQPKPEVPQCVAEWLEGLKKEFPDNLPNQLYHVTRQGWGYGFEYEDSYTEEMKTLYNCGGKIKKDLVNALLYGYTVEKEKLYKVRDKRLSPNRNYLNFDEDSECWFFSNGNTALSLKAEHPRKALEESGFNVFDDDNYEVIEVTE
ncbi:TPA: DUF1642 domain-containing protein [Streptococcus agalactiae]|nr:DUF1642 domain-containing protein [Streptococcus agalactiae]HEN3187104.1 DUF1642 domain-containing protein [Streptococcus agalactiae]HEN3195737.1 DUF1642 domain-containing protein [Streptococcus agalactiae]HEN3223098.1 DUF1642 domain-containing protein [Streptococcus agalactiae]